MRPISSSGSVSPLAQLAGLRAQSQQKKASAPAAQSQKFFDPTAAARSKDLAATLRLQNHEPYNLGNAFAHYESLAAS